ncbi:hypothetical protein, partial [Sphingobacterium kitahiroshimense]|uniref:hypothetical protein n=1 Tax=Sphingobacterium kitahiroshimense TaxID=470446 RepID=UPI003208068C
LSQPSCTNVFLRSHKAFIFLSDIPFPNVNINAISSAEIFRVFPKFKDHIKHFGADVLKQRSLRGRFIVHSAREKKIKLLELYPEVYRNCSNADKSSFLGMTPNYYCSIII